MFIKRKHTKKPEYPVKIDWSNPLARGLEGLYINYAGGLFNLVTNKFISNPSSTATNDTTVNGTMRGYDGVNIGYDVLPSKDRSKSTLGFTAILDVLQSNDAIVSLGSSLTDTPLIHNNITTTASSSTISSLFRPDVEGSRTTSTTKTVVTGEYFTFSTINNDTTHKVKINNNSVVTSPVTITDSLTIDRIGFCGLRRTASAVPADGRLGLVWLYDRELSDFELASLHKNPYQLLQPRSIYIPEAGFKPYWAINATVVQSLQGMS